MSNQLQNAPGLSKVNTPVPKASVIPLEDELNRVKKENAELRAISARLQANIKSRFAEIAILTKMVRTTSQVQKEDPISVEINTGLDTAQAEEWELTVVAALQKLARRNALYALHMENQEKSNLGHKVREILTGKAKRRNLNEIERQASLLRLSGLFDEDWYLSEYRDVQEIDPVVHYLQQGAKEGRDPSPLFSTNAYLKENTDVKDAGLNPLLHYIMYGSKEERLIYGVKK